MTKLTMLISLILFGTLVGCSPNAEAHIISGTPASVNSSSVRTPERDKTLPLLNDLKFTLMLNTPEWQIGSPDPANGLVKLHVENSSDLDIQLRGPGIFLLLNESSKKARDQYVSSSALPGSTTTELTPSGERTIRRSWIRCAKHGTLDLEIDLRTVKWARQNQSESPSQDFMQLVAAGRYELIFVFTVAESMNEDIPISTRFESNKVNLVLK